MKLPKQWIFEERANMKFASPEKHDGLALEVRKIGNYYRAELLVASKTPNCGSWLCGFWFHHENEQEAIAQVEVLAVAAGIESREIGLAKASQELCEAIGKRVLTEYGSGISLPFSSSDDYKHGKN